jgi:hypothetical protein
VYRYKDSHGLTQPYATTLGVGSVGCRAPLKKHHRMKLGKGTRREAVTSKGWLVATGEAFCIGMSSTSIASATKAVSANDFAVKASGSRNAP